MTDEELVARARAGDAAACRAALAALRNPEDAEEVTQDAFVRAWSNLGRFRGDAAFRTWLLTIVWNRALSRRRSVLRWWRRAAPLDEAGAVAAGESGAVAGVELRRHATVAIQAISPKLRDTLLPAQSGD